LALNHLRPVLAGKKIDQMWAALIRLSGQVAR
jgi:hypothetical protein